MLGKVDKNVQEEGNDVQILVSNDGGTTWVGAVSDDEGRLIIKSADTSDTVINPATEDKQDDMIGELETLNSLVPSKFDYIALTYVSAGNGTGKVETATYKTGGAGGTTVATLTMAYDASDRLSSVTKS